jgi:3-hydroxy-9,10-secoandrosta-1,3,5(10)-triene-9,17-dione monooxygenase reductase component
MSDVSPPLDPRRFRDTIGLFATGVAVIVARAGDEVLAMTANAVSSASLDPMLVLFCPSKKTRFAQALTEVSGFTINFLRHEQQALSTYFAGGWREPVPPPFRLVPAKCAPRLEGSLASLGCDLERLMELGDHWLVIGRVQEMHTGIAPHRPLLFYSGRYRNVDFSESAPAPDLTSVHDEPAHVFYDRWQNI